MTSDDVERAKVTSDPVPPSTTDPAPPSTTKGKQPARAPADGEFEEHETPRKGAAFPPQEPFNPEKFRERTRAWLAGGLTALLAAVVLILLIALVIGAYATKDAVDLLGVLLSPLVALVGAATGFYYGGKSK